MKLPNCTIVMPTRNRADEIRITVQHLCDQNLADTPVVVVDDASDSPEETRAALDLLENVRFIAQEKRTGQAAARNVGLEAAETEYCLFFDDDAHLVDAAPLIDLLRSELPVDVAVWRFETIREHDGYRDGLPERLPSQPIPSFIGFGVLMRRSDVLSVGGYRRFFCYRHEEDDLALRLFRTGYTILYQPGIRFIHRHTPVARSSKEYDLLSNRNILLLYALNYPFPWGPALGCAKSLRVLTKLRTNPWSRIKGVASGMWAMARYWTERTPLSRGQLQELRLLRGHLAGQIRQYS